jgi:hypothetical protein
MMRYQLLPECAKAYDADCRSGCDLAAFWHGLTSLRPQGQRYPTGNQPLAMQRLNNDKARRYESDA